MSGRRSCFVDLSTSAEERDPISLSTTEEHADFP